MKKLWALMICLAILAFSGNVYALSVTTTANGGDLVNTIVGTGITVDWSSVSYSGAAGASGTFTDGISSGIGIDEGIILTSGDASLAPGPNTSDAATGNNGLSGNSALDALIPGYTTYDATILSFNFETTGGDLFFNYVFASEEYNEYTNTQYNDVFAFFLDGTDVNDNIALIPGTTTPVSINNVNGGNPYGTAASNPEYFNNNDLNDGGPFYDIEYDGFTDVFMAQVLGIGAGTHTITLAIADSGDHILDSTVFIQAGTFSGTPTAPVPEPSTILLVGTGLLGIIGFSRKRLNKKA
jgi:hypothetical protein